MKTGLVDYKDGGTVLEGYLARDDSVTGPRPEVEVSRIAAMGFCFGGILRLWHSVCWVSSLPGRCREHSRDNLGQDTLKGFLPIAAIVLVSPLKLPVVLMPNNNR